MVKKALEGLAGVGHAEVNLATKQAVVTYDAGRVTLMQMLAAIKDVGFTAQRHHQ